MAIDIRQLSSNDVGLMKTMLTTFGEAFDDMDVYSKHQPRDEYLRRLLGGDSFIAIAAVKGSDVVGGIAAYELRKFEQERSEIYIYDLAVSAAHRREGIATALIEDEPAIALYTKLGVSEDILHFDILVN